MCSSGLRFSRSALSRLLVLFRSDQRPRVPRQAEVPSATNQHLAAVEWFTGAAAQAGLDFRPLQRRLRPLLLSGNSRSRRGAVRLRQRRRPRHLYRSRAALLGPDAPAPPATVASAQRAAVSQRPAMSTRTARARSTSRTSPNRAASRRPDMEWASRPATSTTTAGRSLSDELRRATSCSTTTATAHSPM